MFTLIAWALSVLAVVWLIDSFVLERQRLRQAVALLDAEPVDEAGIERLIKPKPWTYPLHVLGLPLIVAVVYLAIQESRDLALLLILATLYAGLVALLDFFLLRPYRRRLAEGLTKENGTLASEAETDSTLVEYSKSFFPVLALVIVLRSFLFEPYQIPSESMRPTLLVGDFLLVNKYAYGLRLPVLKTRLTHFDDPEPGEVMVFTPPHQASQNYIKRVIGVGGDRVQYNYQTKEIRVNGEPIPREFVGQKLENGRVINEYEETLGDYTYNVYQIQNAPTPNWPELDLQVPEGHYFVVGDNRDNSLDSRFWEQQYGTSPFADGREIQGKAVLRWMFWPDFFSLPSFSRFGSIH